MITSHEGSSSPGAAIVAHIDGASRGNPGPASYAVVLSDARGTTVEALAKAVGVATNNVAEYRALLAALEYARRHRLLRLTIRTDSELLARQLQGRYKVKNPGLKILYEHAQKLIRELESFSIEHVPREQNREADALANQALDSAGRENPR